MITDMESEEILLIDKPTGITSFDVIRALRKELNIRKIGHAGTLDPLATGLMLLGVGPGTKKLKDLIGLSKRYRAEVLLGVKTDTADTDGKIIEEKSVPDISKEKVEEILNGLLGENLLPAPVYSAIKKAGKPLYKRVREGEDVTPPMREMMIEDIKIIDFKKDTIIFEVGVSSGTYIRSIAEEIGIQLETVATLKGLRRLSIGEYDVKDARKIEYIK